MALTITVAELAAAARVTASAATPPAEPQLSIYTDSFGLLRPLSRTMRTLRPTT